jgi:hypothetical protein
MMRVERQHALDDRQLTAIGNNLQIRHFETTQEKLDRAEQVDYLFHRMFSFTRLIMHSTGREGLKSTHVWPRPPFLRRQRDQGRIPDSAFKPVVDLEIIEEAVRD